MKPEAKFRAKIMPILRAIPGSYWFRLESGATQSGIPDIVGLIRGVFIGIECKASTRSKPTKIQMFVLQNISENGGIAAVAHPENFSEIHASLLKFADTGEMVVVEKGDILYN